MLKKIFRPETVLLFLPAIVSLIVLISAMFEYQNNEYADTLMDRTLAMFVLTSLLGEALAGTLAMICPFVMYRALRRLHLTPPSWISWLHTGLTAAAALGAWLGPREVATSVVPGWHTTIYPPAFAFSYGLTSGYGLAILIIQALFALYFARRIKASRIGQRPDSVTTPTQ